MMQNRNSEALHLLNGRSFVLTSNSVHGTADGRTCLHFEVREGRVTARIEGGTVVFGQLLAISTTDGIRMVYHLLSTGGELRSGQADAQLWSNADGILSLRLDWEWLSPGGVKGDSAYTEAR